MMPCSNMYYVPRCDRVDDCLCCFKSVSRYAVFHLEREGYGWEKRRRGRDMAGEEEERERYGGRRGGEGEIWTGEEEEREGYGWEKRRCGER